MISPIGLGRGGSLDQVIAMDGRGAHGLGQSRGDELKHGHLRGRVLHRHAVCMGGQHRWLEMPGPCMRTAAPALLLAGRTGSQPQVADTTLELLALWVIQVPVDDLAKAEWKLEAAGRGETLQLPVAPSQPASGAGSASCAQSVVDERLRK